MMKPLTLDDNHLALRLFVALLLGIVIAGALTWFMHALIQYGEQELDDSKRVQILDFVRLKRDESSAKKDRRVERPQPSEAPPAPPAPDASADANDGSALAISDLGMHDMNIDMGGMGISSGEGNYLPIVKVAPVYPASAANKGIEGTCVVEYTVTTKGTTKDIRVLEDQCDYRGFERPSIAAAKRFKYKPRIIGGEAVEVEGVKNAFHFQLSGEN